MARLDWEKANRREQFRAEGALLRKNVKRQKAMDAFVRKHGIACFKCSGSDEEWAKTGISARGAWAICVPCVQSGAAARPRGPIAEA